MALAGAVHVFAVRTAMKHIVIPRTRDNLYLALVVLVTACTWGMILYLAARAY